MARIEKLTPRAPIANPDGSPSGYMIGRDEKLIAPINALTTYANATADLGGGAVLADVVVVVNALLAAARTTP